MHSVKDCIKSSDALNREEKLEEGIFGQDRMLVKDRREGNQGDESNDTRFQSLHGS